MRLGILAIALVLSAMVATRQDKDTIVYAPGNGVTLPNVLREVEPDYTPEARAARIEGTVMMEAVVLSNGSVGDVKVVQSLDTKFGLDNQAVTAAKQWMFRPGTKDGKPVAVRVRIELTFNLRSQK